MTLPEAMSGMFVPEGRETPLSFELEVKPKNIDKVTHENPPVKKFEDLFEKNWSQKQQERLQRQLLENPHDQKLRDMTSYLVKLGRRLTGRQPLAATERPNKQEKTRA